MLTLCYVPVLHQSRANYTDSTSEMCSRSFEGSRGVRGELGGASGVGVGSPNPICLTILKLQTERVFHVLCHVLTGLLSVLLGVSSHCASFFSRHIFVSSSPLVLIGILPFSRKCDTVALQPSLRVSSPLVSRGTTEWHEESVFLLVHKEKGAVSSQSGLFDSRQKLLSCSDVSSRKLIT